MAVFVVRCWYGRGIDYSEGFAREYPDGVGYLDDQSHCTRNRRYAAEFEVEAEAWDHARLSGERVPQDCWAEEDLGAVDNTAPV